MIKKYFQFIKENINNSIIFSDKLFNKLKSMDNKFANAIIDLQKENINDFIIDYANYLNLEDDGTISYIKNNLPDIVDFWNDSRRQKIKPTKLLTKIFKDQNLYLSKKGIIQRDIEVFANNFKIGNEQILIWKGNDILRAFNYTKEISKEFSKSCANFHQKELNSHWSEPNIDDYRVYTENEKNIAVIVIIENGIIMGRRMLFHGIQTMDYGYFKKGEYYGIASLYYGVGGYNSKYDIKLLEWCKNNNYLYINNSYNINGLANDSKFIIKLENYKYKQFPPFDLFYINIDTGEISYPDYPYTPGVWKQCYKLYQNI